MDTPIEGLVVGTGNKLYDACVESIVSERTANDSWEKVAMFVHTARQCGATLFQVRANFQVVEHQIKSDFKLTTLPTAWRTAKSTALKAVANNQVLVAEGKPLGKTAVEDSMKGTSSTGAVVPRNTAAAVAGHIAAARHILPHIVGMDCVSLSVLITDADALRTALAELPCA